MRSGEQAVRSVQQHRQNLSVWGTHSLPLVFQVGKTVNGGPWQHKHLHCLLGKVTECSARLASQELFHGFRCKWERSPPVLICICSGWTRFPSQVHTLHLQCWNDSAKAISFFYSIHINLFLENPSPGAQLLLYINLALLAQTLFHGALANSSTLHPGLDLLLLLRWDLAANCPFVLFPILTSCPGSTKSIQALLKDQESGGLLIMNYDNNFYFENYDNKNK